MQQEWQASERRTRKKKNGTMQPDGGLEQKRGIRTSRDRLSFDYVEGNEGNFRSKKSRMKGFIDVLLYLLSYLFYISTFIIFMQLEELFAGIAATRARRALLFLLKYFFHY